ncbi:MAG TPA: hypothetical protein DCR27_13445 [Lachnospiraceae bacterium]|nr:hypothetical protein [Lachnospiraceae bacterium]
MNVVHISTSISPSSANTQLQRALQRKGIHSLILTLKCSTAETNVQEVKRKLPHKVKALLFNRWFRMALRRYKTADRMPFSASRTGINLSRLNTIKNADIIHLHWICDFLSPKMIRNLLSTGKPVVWTCHDSWPFTGGCHVRYGCSRYRQGCGECPLLHSTTAKDITYRILKTKEKYLSGQKISFIAPSNWMKVHIEKSRVFGPCLCKVIPNTINTVTFRELNDLQIQDTLAYVKDKEKLHILFGATDVDIPYKGFRYLSEMLEILHARHEISQNIVLHVVGAGGYRNSIPKDYEHICWGYIREPEKMAALYNLADIFIYPSIDDNLPNMVMESLACATPVVAFRTGGIPDMVVHMENGYLAKYMDTQDLLKGLLWVAEHNAENRLGKNGHMKIIQEFSEEIVAQKHIQLYRELLH